MVANLPSQPAPEHAKKEGVKSPRNYIGKYASQSHKTPPENTSENEANTGAENTLRTIPSWVTSVTSEGLLPPVKKGMVYRFFWQAVAREVLPVKSSIRFCLRRIHPKADRVQVRVSEIGRVRLGNVMTCKSLWICPICAHREGTKRRSELKRAIAYWERRGGQVVMITLTFHHNRTTSLKKGLDSLKAAQRRFKSGRAWQSLKTDFGIVGTIGAVEVTWGEKNGWHPHVHMILVLEKPLNRERLADLGGRSEKRWLDSLAAEGRMGLHGVAFNLSSSHSEIGNYVGKWGMASEVQPLPGSKSATGEHYTPWDMLAEYYYGRLENTPESLAWSLKMQKLFREFSEAFHGRRQLIYSDGLRELMGLSETDDSDADLTVDHSSLLLASLSADAWYRLVNDDKFGKAIAGLIRVAKKQDRDALGDFLEGYGIKPDGDGCFSPRVAMSLPGTASGDKLPPGQPESLMVRS